jgi:Transposase DDE domain
MVAQRSVCLRRLGGDRAGEVRFGRFPGNDKVTVERLIAGWSEQTVGAVAGRHVLAIQDTSEVLIATTRDQRRGLGEIGKGTGHGLLIHAMIAVDAEDRACLGLVGGRIWTRQGRVSTPHGKRALADKESQRWLSTAETAKSVLAAARAVTIIADRESDFYDQWARVPAPRVHLLGRVMQDRRLVGGGHLFTAAETWPEADRRSVTVDEHHPDHSGRTAELALRFASVAVRRPRTCRDRSLPKSVQLSFIQLDEIEPPEGVAPICWRLLTTHALPDVATAWRIVDWYRQRWLIEQLFRLLKKQGLGLEDTQITEAERLLKLAAVATKAATVTLQLLQARDGETHQAALVAFTPAEIDVLSAIDATLEGKTAKQKNPHPPTSLAGATWIIARLGGWDGYASSRLPGPITLHRGLQAFAAIAHGFALGIGFAFRAGNVCIP